MAAEADIHTMNGQGEKGWRRFWVVGLGNHARTKLIPALIANRQELAGLVTRQAVTEYPGIPTFDQMGPATHSMARGDVVVIATPPSAHYDQCMAAVRVGVDVIVEKPAFVTASQAEGVRTAAAATGSVVVEAFMHRHSALYGRLVDLWRPRRDHVRKIAVVFLIPAMPTGTFRESTEVAASALYDMGCYPLSLFLDLGLDPAVLSIKGVRCPGDPMREAINMAGVHDGVSMTAEIGVGSAYANRVEITFDDGPAIAFEPFFFGRAGLRNILTYESGGVASEAVEENDAFRVMLSQPVDGLRREADAGWSQMISAARHLERLGVELMAHRSGH